MCANGTAYRAPATVGISSGLKNSFLRLACFLATTMLASCISSTSTKFIPLPVLSSVPVDIRVAYVVNPRLPRMEPAEIEVLLESMRKAVLEHFGVHLQFGPAKVVTVESLFDTIPAQYRDAAQKISYDFKSGFDDRKRLDEAFGLGFRQSGESLEELAAFARPHTGALTNPSFESFGARMVGLQLERIRIWRERKGLDGYAAIDHNPFNEFAMWASLGTGDLPYELVLTNQIIVSMEYADPAVHAAIRGGYTNGVTNYNRRSSLGTTSIWSTYAFTGNDEQLVHLRGGESYTPEEAAKLAGLSGAHELGHQLLHLGHPFGNPACLMKPVLMLRYREWASQLNSLKCALGSSATMTPGAVRFRNGP